MESHSNAVLMTLLSHRYPKSDLAKWLAYLPEQDKEECQVIKTVQEGFNPLSLLHLPKTILERMHYSWLIPLFKFYPDSSHPCLGAVLSQYQKAGVQRMLQTSWPDITLSRLSKRYFTYCLYQALGADKPLPFETVFSTKLSLLYYFNKEQLIKLMDLLSMYDLAAEIRQLKDSKIINRIHSLLSADQRRFLEICLRQREAIDMSPLGIAYWKRSMEDLKRALHHRGISRLGWALTDEHDSLIWYLSRTLDIGRGMLLQCSSLSEADSWMKQFFQNQVANLIKVFLPHLNMKK
ncbi:MAG: hypothetical protein K0S74_828 [Chlamydiales bacterium]|jgi:hypothetical protein|nr:hypothetical protein [Chlamydiales bacterium]